MLKARAFKARSVLTSREGGVLTSDARRAERAYTLILRVE
jgi:hypothetical protein